MINKNDLVNDGLTSTCANNRRTPWTYNQVTVLMKKNLFNEGVIIGGLVNMYKATKNMNYLQKAK